MEITREGSARTAEVERQPELSLRRAYSDKPETQLSLDRIDNTKGYIRGNVVATSTELNLAKGAIEGSNTEYNKSILNK